MNPNATADDRPEIHRALARMRDATGLPLTFGGEVGAGRQVQLSQITGPHTGALRGVSLEYGRGLGGKAVAQRRPVVVDDYVRSPGISHHYDHIIVAEGLRAVVAVPVVVRRNVRGVLYGALRSSLPLGDRVVHAVVESARELEQTLAVRDEVTRRLAWLDRYDATDCHRPHWELVREAYAELRTLSQSVEDPVLRARVRAICETLSAVSGRPARAGNLPRLAARELDVLACVALGWTNQQIAEDLGISTETVKSYLRSASRKLVARSRMEAVVTARRFGLLP
ncbi:helix-turn-helix transcriptional regulator [Amycolatopsis vancoresmycina]|uniref:Transcriptional regulator n=1 Tax=Amycolatopsis vancoresmycina DSM 44592 TaxID=1292037 RepID=R1HB19_9PSEU|nr:LuxR C-terminal-related transcriptional regulator [Amycolatopsis vancoresmycina]EOD57636.1 transcriptional regulator [Amycolatopsis vancoresmycina DSM 44592]